MTNALLETIGGFRRRCSGFVSAFNPSLAHLIDEGRYKITPLRTLAHHAAGWLPPFWREPAAERFLRREGAPAPAAEHVFQYLLSARNPRCNGNNRKEAVVAKGADMFYERQYRQYFNPVMGAFAMTATRALLGAGGAPRLGRRKTFVAMLDDDALGAPPILVPNRQTAAVPLLLPKPRDKAQGVAMARWLAGRSDMPAPCRELAEGKDLHSAQSGARAFERSIHDDLLDLAHAVIATRKLAVLALHPFDPDAMGLHITLCDVEILTPKFFAQDYGVAPQSLSRWSEAAASRDKLLFFCVGATEELFTQCSQNLFIKRPMPSAACEAPPLAWSPSVSLERLIEAQFELLQVTVSASGLPGASPRNGDIGKAAFVERRRSKTYVLIPYYPGNAVHGHAAKLWSNSYGSLLVYDDVSARAAVSISGPCRIITHETALRRFPASAGKAAGKRKKGSTTPAPEYWFVQEASEIAQQREILAAHALDPARPTCSINAGGRALHGKKPHYFAAEGLPSYDMELQHHREATGRPLDPGGVEGRKWHEEACDALAARLAHLRALPQTRSLPAE
jgi:hypothetical protein